MLGDPSRPCRDESRGAWLTWKGQSGGDTQIPGLSEQSVNTEMSSGSTRTVTILLGRSTPWPTRLNKKQRNSKKQTKHLHNPKLYKKGTQKIAAK